MSAYNGKVPQIIFAFGMEAFFEQLDLIKHLSRTRGNDLRSMVQRIQAVTQATNA